MTSAADPYRAAAFEQAWRLIGLIDRNPHSKTRGSFSRTHWAWKFSDFPFPRLQEGVYALARMRALEDPRNPLYRAGAASQWVRWGFEYWASLQHPNGSYDEAYPNEQCVAATAFTTFYLGHAYLLSRDELEPALRSRLDATFHRAGGWLREHDETHGVLSNHLAAAAAGLEVAARITGDAALSARAAFFVDRIVQHQSTEGWLREYDGADIGYGTHAFFYLAAYWKMTGCSRTKAVLEQFADFLAYFVHPDGTVGGEYGSRDTEFYSPAGFEIFAPVSASAAAIAAGLRQSIADRRVCGVWGMDSYNFMPMLNSLLFAADAAQDGQAAAALPWQRAPFTKRFDDAGLWIVNTQKLYAVVGLSKGGTVAVFDKTRRRLAARHSGLVARAGSGTFTSHMVRTAPPARWSPDAQQVEIDVPWKSLATTAMTPVRFLAFRLFTLTAARVESVSRWLKDRLVDVLIRRSATPPFMHLRRIAVVDDGIEIADDLHIPGASDVSAIEQFTSIHMGSALYADVRSVAAGAKEQTWTVPANAKLRLRGRMTLDGADWTAGEA